MKINKSPVKLFASIKAVIALFLSLSEERNKYIVERVKRLTEEDVEQVLEKVTTDFGKRHRNLKEIHFDNFSTINEQFNEAFLNFSSQKKRLLGAFFTKEYSIQAAALFNPSIVPHPDQTNLKDGELRFVMSLRATGEGHISSVCFQTGIVDKAGNILLDEPPQYYTRLKKSAGAVYENESDYDLEDSSQLPLNEKVIFPYSKAESMGIEDVRFVEFKDGSDICYYGTYTAYNGKNINTQMIETKDFNIFKIRTLNGDAISDKGMALFPEKINGKYVMISRQGAEKLSIMYSGDLYQWDTYELLMEPKYPWEIVQIGNCGSPVKTDKGWLLLTHGVGAMRTYVISAVLLHLSDPSKIIGRMDKPFLFADEEEREGYVPNVVYTCGLLRHGNLLIIPYAVSDYAVRFVTIELNDLLEEMKPCR
jgi:predicted GH43/DUF377 family glycosyl hydrolase